MDNKAMALTVNTFDDLLNMNADMHDSIRRLTVKYADCKSSIRHAALIKACMRSGNLQYCHECNTWRLKIKGKPDVIVPKSCSTKSYATLIANKINAMINKSSEDEALTPPELYQYSTDSTGLTAALE